MKRAIRIVNCSGAIGDGGALHPQALAEAADTYFRSPGITSVRIAWVTGDNVTQQVPTGQLGAWWRRWRARTLWCAAGARMRAPRWAHVDGRQLCWRGHLMDAPARDAALCADKAAVQPNYGPTVTMPDYKGTVIRPFGDLVSARSGDKGGNANIRAWVRDDAGYPWFQAFLTSGRAQALLGDDWRPEYEIERCEFPKLRAVHILVRSLL
ncbi:uncharacterized protein SPSK_11000 [Sporothrix schenckii 1099-18]|uniref:Acyclic terpene utilisation N-terminal domain-containing protein n=1 Tax=Sporothrix schenckii 1099-18 TaxID=1397361 RepID=A0A0F2M415_SPOSC|nr:uncharacterized protein SPSK_11000 [Sporothrix schenckii 1099-18]KJR83829.1 hypothetical protein SPSK_11000 [Sporothrix schenckii 1099-18]